MVGTGEEREGLALTALWFGDVGTIVATTSRGPVQLKPWRTIESSGAEIALGSVPTRLVATVSGEAHVGTTCCC